jgi:hypothetical protein
MIDNDEDLADFAKMLGIDMNLVPLKKPNKNQKAIDELSKILKKYGG